MVDYVGWVCWLCYKIKIYAQMLALVHISQIVPYFSSFWQFYGCHNTKSKQAHHTCTVPNCTSTVHKNQWLMSSSRNFGGFSFGYSKCVQCTFDFQKSNEFSCLKCAATACSSKIIFFLEKEERKAFQVVSRAQGRIKNNSLLILCW